MSRDAIRAMRIWRVSSALSLLAATGLGCKINRETPETFRAAATAKLAAFEAAGSMARQSPPLGEDKLAVEGPPPEFPPHLGKHNALAISLEDFDNLAAASRNFRLVTENPVADIASWLRSGVLADGEKPEGRRAERLLDQMRPFASLRYVLIMRTLGTVDARSREPSTFVGGVWNAEALLYDLEQQKRVGGVRVTGRNDKTVEVAPSNVEGWLAGNLRERTLAAAREAFEASFAGAHPPFTDE